MGRFNTWLPPRKEENNGRSKESTRLFGIRDVKNENIEQT